jgi:hypothetical protein
MKHAGRLQWLIITLALMLFTLSASAHTYRALAANVPFKFSVGKRTFRPGAYRFVATGTGLLALLDSKTRIVAVFMTRPAQTSASAGSAQLIFEKGKKHLQLARIAMDGSEQEILGEEPTGHELPMGSFLPIDSFAPSASINTPRLPR